MLNDIMQSLAPALYPVFRDKMALSFFQTGLITFVFQVTASLLQPFIGLVTDRRPMNALLPAGDGVHADRPGRPRLRRHVSAAACRRWR